MELNDIIYENMSGEMYEPVLAYIKEYGTRHGYELYDEVEPEDENSVIDELESIYNHRYVGQDNENFWREHFSNQYLRNGDSGAVLLYVDIDAYRSDAIQDYVLLEDEYLFIY